MSQKQKQHQQHQKKKKQLFPFLRCAVSLESWNSKRFNYPIVSPLCLATESPGNKAPRCLLRDLFLKVKLSEPNLSSDCKTKLAGKQAGSNLISFPLFKSSLILPGSAKVLQTNIMDSNQLHGRQCIHYFCHTLRSKHNSGVFWMKEDVINRAASSRRAP